jgi:Ni/Co efflux regulator RcnB
MTSTKWMTIIALATAMASPAAMARSDRGDCRDDAQYSRAERHDGARHQRDERRHERRGYTFDGRSDSPMLRYVPNRSLPTQAAWGWTYYSDPRSAHAVVINSAGDYFLSLGDGPRQITGLAAEASPTPPVQN